jgi:hypothetical protein
MLQREGQKQDEERERERRRKRRERERERERGRERRRRTETGFDIEATPRHAGVALEKAHPRAATRVCGLGRRQR